MDIFMMGLDILLAYADIATIPPARNTREHTISAMIIMTIADSISLSGAVTPYAHPFEPLTVP